MIGSMRLSYDERAGTAYLRLREDGDDVGAISSQPYKPPGSDASDDYLVLDFDERGHLVGIEFLTPEQRLCPVSSPVCNLPPAGHPPSRRLARRASRSFCFPCSAAARSFR
jgi:uncharacterized protein YuzE